MPIVGGNENILQMLHPRNFISIMSAPLKKANNEVAVLWSLLALGPVNYLGWKTLVYNPMTAAHCPMWQIYIASAWVWTAFVLAAFWPMGTAYLSEDGDPHPYSMITLSALGYYFIFGSCVLFGYMLRIIINSSRRYRGVKPVDKVTYAKFMWAFIFAMWAQHVGKGNTAIVTHEFTLEVPNWPECLNGYKVVLFSDTHIGPAVGKTAVDELASLVEQQDAQLILMAGDIADGPPKMRAKSVDPLLRLNAPDGVYYVTGNHDYMHGSTGEDWISYFHSSENIEPLINRKVILPKNPPSCGDDEDDVSTFQLLGVPDFTANPNLRKVWNTTNSQEGPTVLLSHQPNQWRLARKLGVDLQLSGHTHGGHWFPWAGLVYLCNVAIAGLAVWTPTKSQLYITDGVFGWGARLRMLTSDNAISVLTINRLPEGTPLPWPSDIGSLVGGFASSAMLLIFFGNISATRRGISWTTMWYASGFAAVGLLWRDQFWHLWFNQLQDNFKELGR